MLNQDQLGEGVEPEARQRLKRMCQWHLNGQKSEELKKKRNKKEKKRKGRREKNIQFLLHGRHFFSGSSSRC